MQSHAWWRATTVALLLVAAALPLATRALVGPSGALVHVRWSPDTDPRARERLEPGLGLTDGADLGDRTWRYNLIDPSRDKIRALVTNPAVDDTHHIDREWYSLAATAERTARPRRLGVDGDTAVRVVDGVSIVLLAVAAFSLVAPRMPGGAPAARQRIAERLRRSARVAGRLTTRATQWLTRAIPEVDAFTAGVFRIVFGCAVVVFFAFHGESATSLDTTFHPLIQGELHASVLQWLRAHPYIVDGLTPWLLALGVAFTAGMWTRLTYPLFVAGVLVWLFVAVTHDSTHPLGALGLTLIALLPARWGDALSVDSWRRPRGTESGVRSVTKQYGYTVWVPGLVLSVAFAAAAWAKLSRNAGWTDWILNGSVKYHFITDAHNAPVDWGLQLAGHPWLAILASFGAVAIEALAITAAFTRTPWYRLAIGAAALSLLGGFWLFMGVVWPGWWILLLGFLPWQHLGRLMNGHRAATVAYAESSPGRPHAGATVAQVALIVAIIAQQIVVSALAVERAPMFTYYPMYSATYASPAQFNASRVPYYRILVSTDRETIELPCNAPEDLVEAFRVALAGAPDAAADVWREVRACAGNRGDLRDVTLEGDRPAFDWARLTLTTERAAVVLGPLRVGSDVPASNNH